MMATSTKWTCCGFSVFLSAVIVIVALSQISVGHAYETVVNVQPYENSVDVGQTFTVNITISAVQNLFGVGLTLKWNASVLRPESVDVRFGEADGVLFTPFYVAENSTLDGSYFLSATSDRKSTRLNSSH